MEITLRDEDTGIKHRVKIREIELCDEEKYMDLQKEVVAKLKDKSIFVTMTSDEFKLYLTKYKAVSMGLFLDGEMYGAWFTVAYKGDTGCLSKDIGIEIDEYGRNCNYETAILHPRFRGQGLNTKMAKMMTSKLIEKGYKYLSATVEPTNYPSMGSILKDGYVILDRKIKYGGFDRYIFCKYLEEPISLSKKDIIFVEGNKRDEISKYLSQGYVGTAICNKEGKTVMQLMRKQQEIMQ